MLTELDNCILGIIWRDGPMSAYDVRSHLARSSTVAWSSSTGTVYPSIRRLVASGLIQASARSGPRKRQLLHVTEPGMAALRRWLQEVMPELGSATADPLRTRVHFLAALPPPQRQRAFDDYRAVTKARVKELESSAAERLELSERLGTLGALREVSARLKWLDEVEAELPRLGSTE